MTANTVASRKAKKAPQGLYKKSKTIEEYISTRYTIVGSVGNGSSTKIRMVYGS